MFKRIMNKYEPKRKEEESLNKIKEYLEIHPFEYNKIIVVEKELLQKFNYVVEITNKNIISFFQTYYKSDDDLIYEKARLFKERLQALIEIKTYHNDFEYFTIYNTTDNSIAIEAVSSKTLIEFVNSILAEYLD